MNQPARGDQPESASRRQRGWASAQQPGMLRALYEHTILTWRLLWDNRVGLLPKLIPVFAVIYAISPLDLLPAFIMGPLAPLGVVDDAALLLLALSLFVKACPPDVVHEYKRELGALDTRQALQMPTDDEDIVDGEAEVLD